MSAQVAAANATQNTAETGSILFKLAVFTACLGLAPISTYFLSQKYLWDGNSTYAAITSIFAANIVLVTYIITAVREDAQSQKPAVKPESESKKDR